MPALLSLLAVLVLLVLFPLLFADLMFSSLGKLHLSPAAALAAVVAIFAGSFVNIPVKTITRSRDVAAHPLAVFGLGELWPELRRVRRETIIAVNVGGCLVPTLLAAYELVYLAGRDAKALAATAIGCAVNVLICYLIARPVPGVGIVMPGAVSPFVAAAMAILLAPHEAAPVAFVVGVAGPLVGADLLHLKDIETSEVGIASIGGAGTFDGIVLSGIVAAYLA